MANPEQRDKTIYIWLFVAVGVVMIVIGVGDLLTSSGNAVFDWAIIACGIFNIGVAALYSRRNG